MKNNVILRFDEEDFASSCIDGFKIKIKKQSITLDEIKLIRDTMEEKGYYVENFMVINDNILEIEGGMEDMPSVEDLSELVTEVKIEEKNLMKIMYLMNFIDIEITLYLSGLY